MKDAGRTGFVVAMLSMVFCGCGAGSSDRLAAGQCDLTETARLISSLDAGNYTAIRIAAMGYATGSDTAPALSDRLRLVKEFIAGKIPDDKHIVKRCVIHDRETIANCVGMLREWTSAVWHDGGEFKSGCRGASSMQIVLVGKDGIPSVHILVDDCGQPGDIVLIRDGVRIRYLKNTAVVFLGWTLLTAAYDKGIVFKQDPVFQAIIDSMAAKEWQATEKHEVKKLEGEEEE